MTKKKTTEKKSTAKKVTKSAKPKPKAAKTAKAPAKKTKAPASQKKVNTAKVKTEKSKAEKSRTKVTMSQREELIHQIKQDLLSQRDSLLKEAEETLSSLPSELNFPDIGDQATAETDRNFMLRLRDRERMLLKKIEETIERIDSEHYGMCSECGNEIGIKRLQARPVTTLCIDCKTRQEEEERIAEGGA